MKSELQYKGYVGSVEVDLVGDAIVGRLMFITDVITYSAATPAGIEAAFREAVDDYLAMCADLGDEPDAPFKGSFNVRVGPELHREAALCARREGIKLNEWVADAIRARCSPARGSAQHMHVHVHASEPGTVAHTMAGGNWLPPKPTSREQNHANH